MLTRSVTIEGNVYSFDSESLKFTKRVPVCRIDYLLNFDLGSKNKGLDPETDHRRRLRK